MMKDSCFRQLAIGVLVVLTLAFTSTTWHSAHDDGTEPDCDPLGPFGVPGLSLPPEQIGQWAALGTWPTQATHAALLSSGKVLWWRTGDPTPTYLWDPITNNVTQIQDAPSVIFCAGHATLADGRVITIGGSVGEAASYGERPLNI